MAEDDPSSLEYVRLNTTELYPLKVLTCDEPNLQIPFPCVRGEAVEYLGRTIDGVMALSNFRLFIKFHESFINIPLGLIDIIELRDIFYINICRKDGNVVRSSFATHEACLRWFQRLSNASSQKKKLQEMFAFCFYAWCLDGDSMVPDIFPLQECSIDTEAYSFSQVVRHSRFKLGVAWRISHINKDFKVCVSYPTEHIVPNDVSDDNLLEVVEFRALHRFPSVVWRHSGNGSVLVRSSQPEVGWLGWRNESDEYLLTAISNACARDAPTYPSASDGTPSNVKTGVKRMLIVDARSYGAAFANRAKGGGYECAEYYRTCDIQFMNLANIHTIRKSFHALRALCAGPPDQHNWLSSLEASKWLHYISALIKSATVVVSAMDKDERPVLVHCSDGWDRTSQIISLAEIIMDPFFRTTKGFHILVEREWLQFGHKFADRCGHSVTCNDTSECCPVFLQWLDCIHQLIIQFPCAFEFNQAFLVKLLQHTYSCMFGTFLCNNTYERCQHHVTDSTFSVWALLQSNNGKFHNYLYSPDSFQVLQPSYQIRDMLLWSAVYLQNGTTCRVATDETIPSSVDETTTVPHTLDLATHNLHKTRSYDNIIGALEHASSTSRRLSDSNIPIEMVPLFTSQHAADSASDEATCQNNGSNGSSVNPDDRESVDCWDETGGVRANEAMIGWSHFVNGNESEAAVSDDHGSFNLISNVDTSVSVANQNDTGHFDSQAPSGEDGGGCSLEVNTLLRNTYCESELVSAMSSERANFSSNSNLICGNDRNYRHVTELISMKGPDGINICRHNKDGLIIRDCQNCAIEGHESCGNGELNSLIHLHSDGIENPKVSRDLANITDELSYVEDTMRVVMRDNRHSERNQVDRVDGLDSDDYMSRRQQDYSLLTNGYSSDCNSRMSHVDVDYTNSTDICYSTELFNFSVMQDKLKPIIDSSSCSSTKSMSRGTICNNDKVWLPSDAGSDDIPKLPLIDHNDDCDKNRHSTVTLMSEMSHSIGTSTTDISDSTVQLSHDLVKCKSNNATAPLSPTKLRHSQKDLHVNCDKARSYSRRTWRTSSTSSTPSPQCLQGSVCAPLSATMRSLIGSSDNYGLAHHLDWDGLTMFVDPGHSRIEQLKKEHEAKLGSLQRQLEDMRRLLDERQSTAKSTGPPSTDWTMEPAECLSNGSDMSWEHLDEQESELVRWVPDHVVTHCAGCDTRFSIVNRRHHCRNCGHIFCGNCSSQTIAVPRQDLHDPTRVCTNCYTALNTQDNHASDSLGRTKKHVNGVNGVVPVDRAKESIVAVT